MRTRHTPESPAGEESTIRLHVLFVCPCGASVSWGSLATPEQVAAEERKHAPHGGLRETQRVPKFRRPGDGGGAEPGA